MLNDALIAKIDLEAIGHNYRLLKKLTKDNPVMAVVKANAYGHGIIEVSRYLEDQGADFFGVARISEAIILRAAGIKSPILIFGYTPAEQAVSLVQYDLIQTVSSVVYAKDLISHSHGIRCHLKIDTGMGRFGITLRDMTDMETATTEVIAIKNLDKIMVEGIYTHFADSPKDSDFTNRQFDIFSALLEKLTEAGIDPGIRHAANSGALIKYQNTHLDLVRSGIALYGLPPVLSEHPFIPALTLEAMVVEKHRLRKGESVSYGRKYTANNDMEIATVALGYADGYFRSLSNKYRLTKDGQQLKQIGTVCMDALMVDCTGIDLEVGDYLEVFGKERSAEELAQAAGTITYEVLTSLSSRVKRLYTGK